MVSGSDDDFHIRARHEIDSFRRLLDFSDSFPLATFSKGESSNGKETENKTNDKIRTINEGKAEKGTIKSQNKQVGSKGNSTKENIKNSYGEESKTNENMNSEEDEDKSHERFSESKKGEDFSKQLSHKKGNYEKGYREKYRLNEEFKHSKFWSNHHTVDKTHRFGNIETEFQKKHNIQHKDKDRQAGEEMNTKE
ncbi:hypothetical protein J6590_039006 [Homalodisca vitripennis]|nr:hypothetical protein J6590_039006 [Homalodisca vitripennis]